MSEYTAEQVEKLVHELRASAMTDDEFQRVASVGKAYAATLRQQASRVDDEMVDAAYARFYRSSTVDRSDPSWSDMLAALEAALAQNTQETPSSLAEAMNVIEHWALQGSTLAGDDVSRFRALADLIAAQNTQAGHGKNIAGYLSNRSIIKLHEKEAATIHPINNCALSIDNRIPVYFHAERAAVPDGWSITPERNPLGGKSAMRLRGPSGISMLFGSFSEEVLVRDFLADMLAAAPQPNAAVPDGMADLLSAAIEANDMCRSAFQVAERVATQYATVYAGTNFGALHERLKISLERQHEVLKPYREAMLADGAPPAMESAHPDGIAVDRFAAAMKEKLAVARAKGRGGWESDEPGMQQRLSDMLRAHVEKGDPRDVANFCMFLHQRGESIMPAQEAEERCESGLPECGPVEHWDSEGIPLCAKCRGDLAAENVGMPAQEGDS